MRYIRRFYTRFATEMSLIQQSRNSASERLQISKIIKQSRNKIDVKIDVKFQTKVREHLYSCGSWRSWLLTLTPFVRVRILLPLPDIGLNRFGSSRFSLLMAANWSKKLWPTSLDHLSDHLCTGQVTHKLLHSGRTGVFHGLGNMAVDVQRKGCCADIENCTRS